MVARVEALEKELSSLRLMLARQTSAGPRRVKATVLLASTSEVYGDPEVHPQPETYWGHVNTVGPRSCYDEGKRVAESLMVAYNKQVFRMYFVSVPCYMFILQIYGNGSQTRSFQYVDDLVDGLISLMNSNCSSPVNIGNPEEHSIANFAQIIRDLVGMRFLFVLLLSNIYCFDYPGSSSEIVNQPSQEDDPQQRKPDISRAAKELNWRPKVIVFFVMRFFSYIV
ncbi:hypothetical protein ANCCEY_06730 [Ancylostoma ceylanicum]|uniref:UDP-glucuronate decarboxylase n=1 Tax=Ancylostoma ceylanicum TaxID=53326 RepID=A0A0D6LQK4_9BILA|nr:hypothetical protein ANCCEY_06730 [Ancylostoma ceylanicum]